MDKKVRVAVVGLGWFGERHLQVLSQLPNVEVVAVCSRTASRARELARRFGVKKTYTDWEKVAKDPNVDAVTVTTHVPDHHEPVIAAAEAGKDVYVEKPIASTLKKADRMISATKRAGVLFMVGHILRFENRYAQAKDAIAQGRLGKIVSMYARRNLPGSTVQKTLTFASSYVLDAIHDTDLMLWYTGKKVDSVYALYSKVNKEVVNPDCCWGMYRFKGGAAAVCETVWVLPPNTPFSIDARMEILGTEGAIYIDCTENGLLVNDSTGTSRPDTIHWPVMHGELTGALKDEVTYWIGCVAAHKQPTVVTPPEAREALRVVLAASASARTGAPVRL